jgi:copper(I)-binding protein
MNPLKLSQVALISAIMLVLQMHATYAGDAIITIEKPWARASILQSRPGAAYLMIRNTGTKPDRLLKVTSPAAGMVMIHESKITDGVAQMLAHGGLDIAAGAELTFRPGGLHLMLMGLHERLREGDTLTLILRFERAGDLNVTVPILGLGASGPK